ncbi:MAG: T9SS type A sorting domain-containing protein [Chitinophagaceae bacterium]|jgi:hypothetical protein
MKKIYLLLMLLIVGVTANAQRNLVLTLSVKYPSLDTNLKSGITVRPQYVIKNVSLTAADSICKTDTIRFRTPANTLTQASGVIFGNTIKPGDSIILNKATVTGATDYELTFAQIETLVKLTADTIKAKSTFVPNTQYLWHFIVTSYSAGPGMPTFGTGGVTTTNTNNMATMRVWHIKTPTGMDEISYEEPSIKTYPNPAANQLSFEYNFLTNEKATATIMDAAGRTVLVKEFENNNIGNQRFDLDITSVSSGMYFLKLNVGEKSMTTKFNVQK